MRGDDCESRGWDGASSPLRGPVLGASTALPTCSGLYLPALFHSKLHLASHPLSLSTLLLALCLMMEFGLPDRTSGNP